MESTSITNLLPANTDNERKYISYLIKNPKEIINVDSDLFNDPLCQMVCFAAKQVIADGLTVETDIIYDYLKDEGVDKDDIVSIYNGYTDFKNITFVIDSITHRYFSKSIGTKVDDVVGTLVMNKDLDVNKLRCLSQSLNDDLSLLDKKTDLLASKELMDLYEKTLEERESDGFNYTLGFKELDTGITRPGAPGEMTGIVGQKGSGKSIFSKSIENILINKKVCVLSINLEMTAESSTDRLLCLRENFNLKDLLRRGKSARFIAKLKRAINRFRKIKHYLYYPEPDLNMEKLDNLIYQAKQHFKEEGVLPENKYIIIFIDLLDMMEEFSGADPAKIKYGINELHKINRKHGTHIVPLLQANENKFRRKSFSTPEQVDSYRIGLEDVEGGAAYGARCRVMISINRPLLMKKHFFPEQIDEWNLDLDFVNIHCIKQNDGDLFFRQFVFGDNFRLYPYRDVDKIKTTYEDFE